MTSVPGQPIWVELFTTDPERAAAFYGDLFGWTIHDPGPEYGGYRLFQREGEPVAGLMRNDGSDDAPDSWTVYLESDDVGDTAAMAVAHGGQVLVEPMPIGDLGAMTVLADPAGAVVGAWQPGTHRGFAALGEVNAPTWFEVLTTAYPESIAFYQNVFGWVTSTLSETAEFRYTTLGQDPDAHAGIMDATGWLTSMRMPSGWQFFLRVADADVCVVRAVEQGGELVLPVDETPDGRVGRLVDPTGAVFLVRGPGG